METCAAWCSLQERGSGPPPAEQNPRTPSARRLGQRGCASPVPSCCVTVGEPEARGSTSPVGPLSPGQGACRGAEKSLDGGDVPGKGRS